MSKKSPGTDVKCKGVLTKVWLIQKCVDRIRKVDHNTESRWLENKDKLYAQNRRPGYGLTEEGGGRGLGCRERSIHNFNPQFS